MPKNYYIFRHGLTAAVKFRRSYGDEIKTAEILPEGLKAIERIGEYLKNVPNSYNTSSAYLRCKQTSDLVGKVSDKEFVLDPRINEYEFLYGSPFDLFKSWDKEDPFQFFKRVESFCNDMASSTFDNIIICTHAAVISAVKKIITKNYLPWFLIDSIEPGVLVEFKEGKLNEINFNPPLSNGEILKTA